MKRNYYLSIGEVSRITGIHIKSLRYYDSIGALKPAYIDPDTRYRYYTYSQLGLIEAIRICVELDIPLKQFTEYTGDNGQRVHYSKLLEYGKQVAEQKYRTIRDSLKYIKDLQKEIKRNEQFVPNDDPISIDMPKKRYMLEPINVSISYEDFYRTLGNLYIRTAENKYKAGYEYGLLYIYRGDGQVERYQFIDILSTSRGRAKDVITFPSACYFFRHISDSKIETAPELFPELFEKGKDLVVIETELITGEYNPDKPIYELRCSVLL